MSLTETTCPSAQLVVRRKFKCFLKYLFHWPPNLIWGVSGWGKSLLRHLLSPTEIILHSKYKLIFFYSYVEYKLGVD